MISVFWAASDKGSWVGLWNVCKVDEFPLNAGLNLLTIRYVKINEINSIAEYN